MLPSELDQPLGQNRKPPRRKRPVNRRAVWAGLAAVLLVAASAVIAFREKPFRQPVIEVAAEKPQPAKTDGKAAVATSPDSPSIIKVTPDGTSTGAIVISDPSAVRQDLRVAHLPDRALVENTGNGFLPIKAADGRRPFDVYSRPWSGARGARVAIVIGGLGLSQTGTQEAIAKLPGEVTLAFAPQGNSIGRWMQEARHKGHELVMQVPLEPFDYPTVNPGRNTLTVSASPAENIDNLLWTLSRTTNYTGVMNYMGARFTSDGEALEPVMAELGKRGLLYLDDGTSSRSLASQLALKNGVPFVGSDAVIDDVRERGAILEKLDQLERTARAKGYAVGTGSAFDVTVDAVRSWTAEARKRGIEIVPVSAVAVDPERG